MRPPDWLRICPSQMRTKSGFRRKKGRLMPLIEHVLYLPAAGIAWQLSRLDYIDVESDQGPVFQVLGEALHFVQKRDPHRLRQLVVLAFALETKLEKLPLFTVSSD